MQLLESLKDITNFCDMKKWIKQANKIKNKLKSIEIKWIICFKITFDLIFFLISIK